MSAPVTLVVLDLSPVSDTSLGSNTYYSGAVCPVVFFFFFLEQTSNHVLKLLHELFHDCALSLLPLHPLVSGSAALNLLLSPSVETPKTNHVCMQRALCEQTSILTKALKMLRDVEL